MSTPFRDASVPQPASPDHTGEVEEVGLTYVRTLYHRMGVEHEGVLVPWSEVEALLGHPHTGAAEEDRLIVQALRAAGAPAWVSNEAEGWVDEHGWGLIGPEVEEATAR